MRVIAHGFPHGQGLGGLMREAVRDQLQGVTGHHRLERVDVPVLHVSRSENKAIRGTAGVHDVHGRGHLVPTRNVPILNTKAEVVLPTILLSRHHYFILQPLGDCLRGHIHRLIRLRGVVLVVIHHGLGRGQGAAKQEDGRLVHGLDSSKESERSSSI